jgi:hypothetical protein
MDRESLHTRAGIVARPVPNEPYAAGPEALRKPALAVWPYAATVAVVLALGLPTLILPFWSDTGIFSVIGKAISEGGFPYVDAWDQKPPAIYLLFAVAIHGPLDLIRNVRLFDLAWTSATAVLLIELGRRWWNLRAGVISGLSYGVIYVTTTGWSQLAQPDGFIGLPLVLALLLQHAGRGRRWSLVAAGLALGFAFQLRFIMALLIPFMPYADVLGAPGRDRFRIWLRTMVWLGAGFVAVQIVLALWLAGGGALDDYIAATRFASGYTRLGGPWQGPDGPTLGAYVEAVRLSFVFWALMRLLLTAPAVIGGFYGAFIAKDRRVQQMVIFSVLAYAGIAAQAKFFWYHYLYMQAFLALLSGWTWDRTYSRLRAVQPPPVALATAMLLVIGLLLATPEVTTRAGNQWKSYVRWFTRPQERDLFLGYFPGYLTTRDTAVYLRERTSPGDTLYIWGYDPLIYLLADRPSASRFIYSFPMMSSWAPHSWTEEFLADIKARPPIYFVAQRNQGAPWITGHNIEPLDYIPLIPDLQQLMDENYELETVLGDNMIYRRKG